jgi:molybdate transport system substrate-binding protein
MTLAMSGSVASALVPDRAPPPSREVVVAAAADLKFAMDELVATFRERQPDVVVRVSYGSSGNFHSQLINRAPFDVFFSADVEYCNRLHEAGLAADPGVFLYAVGRIALWVSRSSPLEIEKQGLEVLLAPGVRRVAIANPRHAPYGRAAEASLKHFGLYERIVAKLVFGENVAQTAQFVQSGAADAGIVALSLAVAPAMEKEGRFWEVPVDAYPRLDQGGVVLKWAKDPEAAGAFRDFVVGPAGRDILERYGFFLPAR